MLLWALELSPMAHLSDIPFPLLTTSGGSCLAYIRALVSDPGEDLCVPLVSFCCIGACDYYLFKSFSHCWRRFCLPGNQTLSMGVPAIRMSLSNWLDSVCCSEVVSTILWFSDQYSLLFLVENYFLLLTTISPFKTHVFLQ